MDRRTFLQTVAGCGVAALAPPAARGLTSGSYFGLHPFIESHPEAVFVWRTAAASKNDTERKRKAGRGLAERIFTLRDAPGVPLHHKFAIKPNLTATSGTGLRHAIVTDPFVVEGIVEGMKQLGIAPGNIYVRDGLMRDQRGIGYREMADRMGVHYADDAARAVTARECPDGVVIRRTEYLGPFAHPDGYVINVAKFKTHNMGLTLCVKNLQGAHVGPHIQFCAGIQEAIRGDFQPDAQRRIDDLWARHRRAGIPRWNLEKAPSMEMWAQRTVDAYQLIRPSIGLNIIEGVYAQNGNAFTRGPGPGGKPEIFLTNMLIFGKDAFRVDILGHYLAGHEPGNFGFFHIARERGASTALNPRNIPVYAWEEGGPRQIALDELRRQPLLSPYLARPGEAEYHLCDEPFAYAPEPVAACLRGSDRPTVRVLGPSVRPRVSSALVIEYGLPADGFASLEMYTAAGERVGILARGWQKRGLHAASWNTGRVAAGTYCCRLRAEGADEIRCFRLA